MGSSLPKLFARAYLVQIGGRDGGVAQHFRHRFRLGTIVSQPKAFRLDSAIARFVVKGGFVGVALKVACGGMLGLYWHAHGTNH